VPNSVTEWRFMTWKAGVFVLIKYCIKIVRFIWQMPKKMQAGIVDLNHFVVQ